MHDEINQEVSQFIDDELPEHKALQLLTEIKKQPELDAKLQRYEMASAILRNQRPVLIKSDFIEKVNQALEQEVVYFLPQKSTQTKSYKSALAIAAGVAGVALVVANNIPKQTDVKQEPYVVASNVSSQQTSTVNQEPVKVRYRKPSTIDPRFNNYLQAHRGNLYTIDSGVQTHARLAGFGQ